MNLKTLYVVKGLGKEAKIDSVVEIHSNEQNKIVKVLDKWNGEMPESSIRDVSGVLTLANPLWWFNYYIAWMFWAWSFVWYTRPWMVWCHLFFHSCPPLTPSIFFGKQDLLT